MRQVIVFLTLSALLAAPGLSRAELLGLARPIQGVAIATAASPQEALAAREVRRYVYLRSGRLLPIARLGAQEARNLEARSVVVAGKESALLGALIEDGALKKESARWRRRNTCSRASGFISSRCCWSSAATRRGRFTAHTGCRASGRPLLSARRRDPDKRAALDFPDLDERAKPLFALRGIQPFHDFPEGPDWWSGDDYKAVIAQLAKLRMNFFGLHTYPEMRPHAEPTVWIGLPGEFGPDGRVSQSYATAYFNTRRPTGRATGIHFDEDGRFSLRFEPAFRRGRLRRGGAARDDAAPKTPEACNDYSTAPGRCCAAPSRKRARWASRPASAPRRR